MSESSAIEQIIAARDREITPGFSVRRVLPFSKRRSVGPFVFVDHMGPRDIAPGEDTDVGPHPHIGLATVTYLYEGGMVHRDSTGAVQRIEPGDVNWMTAGSGVVHSERATEQERGVARRLHGVQTWVALPRAHEEVDASFAHHPMSSLPVSEQNGAWMRLIAGSLHGLTSPVQTYSSLFYADLRINASSAFTLSAEHVERAIYVISGELRIDDESFVVGQMAVLRPGAPITFIAKQDTVALLLGGEPLDGPRVMWWNFVASSQERIERAKREWADDLFAKIPGEIGRIPLPPS